MTRKPSVFSISKYAIEPTEKAIIMSALPAGYSVRECAPREIYDEKKEEIVGYYTFEIFFDRDPATPIGWARLNEDENVEIKAVNSIWEEDIFGKLKKKYPEYDEDRILWAIFYEWYGEWAMSGSPFSETDSKKFVELMAGLTEFQLTRNPVLCTFRAGDCVGNKFPTLSTKKILSNWELGEDEGPIQIQLTNMEDFQGESTEETSGLE